MGDRRIPQTMHAYTVADRWHGDAPHFYLLPAGSEIGVVLATSVSSPEKLIWELKAIEISKIDVSLLLFISTNKIYFEENELHFDGGDFFTSDTPLLGDLDHMRNPGPQKPESTFC